MSPHSHYVRQAIKLILCTYHQIWGNSHTYQPILRILPRIVCGLRAIVIQEVRSVCINNISHAKIRSGFERALRSATIALDIHVCSQAVHPISYTAHVFSALLATLAISEQLHQIQSNVSKSFFRKIKLKFVFQ